MQTILKYPRTQHIETSRLQPGDEDLESVQFSAIKGMLVAEEKIDGSNCAISFVDGKLMLQSRGHYLVGHDKPHFSLLKSWAYSKTAMLWDILQHRYIMYGEWMYAKHTVFYDNLPHYFLEFDIFDREQQVFLDTPTRHAMLANTGIISVPVLDKKEFKTLSELVALVGRSKFKTDQMKNRLMSEAKKVGLDPAQVEQESDMTLNMEGLYIKAEKDGIVRNRYKWVRSDFCQKMVESGTHWSSRPIIQNLLSEGTNLFED